ncbi:hypothetical protein DM860_001360 [Cuscuta australis]|uniref:ABC transporter domain-containing protein n=1 Tax=Cuscuta australis TaxID=267555 RepID=A0A328DV29_9ASTE|nr:hypothetical protein DM860_001360 [Cuscuta australis]
MGKKKTEDSGAHSKANLNKGEASKDGKRLSVSAMLARMDKKAEGPVLSKPKGKPTVLSYTDGIDLPPSDDEDEVEEKLNVVQKKKNQRSDDASALDVGLTAKERKKREKKDVLAAQAAEHAKQAALNDDDDPFDVKLPTKTSVLEGDDDDDDASANVKDITIENFSLSAPGKELLKNATVRISHGKRYGLVGPNGCGKSTLLKHLFHRKVPVPKNIDIHLVEQEVIGDEKSALEAVVSANKELVELRKQVSDLQKSEEEDDGGEKLGELYERLQLLGSDAAEAQASKILAGLGFTQDMQARPTRSFSGGWRMRISLAGALFMQPTLLLLDEPTNHLDLRAVLWLEEYLSRWKKTLVVVSHDRDFLNSVCNEIIHFHEFDLHHYRGNFDDFIAGCEQRRKERNKKHEKHEKLNMAAKRSGNQVQIAKVKQREAPEKWTDYEVEFHFPEPTDLTPPLLQLINISFTYPNRQDFKLSDVDVGIDMGTRVAIVGPNGAGKSTLLNLLAGDLLPTEGEIRRSQKLRIGRYSQHFVDLLTMNENPVQYLLRLHPDQDQPRKVESTRSKLAKFGLKGVHHLTPIAKLSGGQKARVVFTSISMSKPHILLLDEPTNHLDMQSIDALADAIDEFTGGVVLVSHDSRLISRMCEDEEKSEIWVVEDGTVTTFPGTFVDYKDQLLKEIKAEAEG